ncbi:metal ABC transporter permease [Limnoglobus roseus]|uniref:Zinc ABC transporter permease n=1 Tax=Limnoglobus roseus TaxID=2598579 RepID=A0A5C1ANK5_9BACT|nr:iron chelate uptake ABC transporter family permease subunit [Limnoglobus roseus]QEL19703.1 zinc ABC transporter permease [Limnoglobus roseus]
MIELFFDPTLQTVAMGTAAIGAMAGFIGTFAVIRRQSLQGDAISHAALPGLAAAFLLGARSPVVLVLGAALAGWVAMALVGAFSLSRRLTFDAALGGTLAVFFGIGLALLTYIKKHVRGAAEHGLERYLFGQAATLRESDLWAVLAVAGVAVAVVLALWKQFQLLSFDPDFAAVQGWRVRGLDWLLTALIVLTVVIGLQAVGVVLMSSLLVAPAVAAKQWQHRLGPLSALAAVFGAFAGFAGTIGSHLLSEEGRTVPTGPMIVISATAIVGVSILWALVRPRLVRKAVRST